MYLNTPLLDIGMSGKGVEGTARDNRGAVVAATTEAKTKSGACCVALPIPIKYVWNY